MKAAILVIIALLAAGCATSAERARYAQADAALRQNPAFVRAYNACVRSYGFGMDSGPDIAGALLGGTTRATEFFNCMERAGWVQAPRWNRSPGAIGFYERGPR